MSDEPRELEWARYRGAFANMGKGPGAPHATLGVAPDVCPCCEERYVVIAAVHPCGAEVSVSLSPEQALQVAHGIINAYAKVAPAAAVARQ